MCSCMYVKVDHTKEKERESERERWSGRCVIRAVSEGKGRIRRLFAYFAAADVVGKCSLSDGCDKLLLMELPRLHDDNNLRSRNLRKIPKQTVYINN